jgi:hypothetical protein
MILAFLSTKQTRPFLFFVPQKEIVEYEDELTKSLNRSLFDRQINQLFNEG